jgi:hypothetical protein
MSNLVRCRKRIVPSIKFDFRGQYGSTWDIPLDLTEKEIKSGKWYPKGKRAYRLPFMMQIPKSWRRCLINCTIIQIYGRMYLVGTVPEIKMQDVLVSYNNLARRNR